MSRSEAEIGAVLRAGGAQMTEGPVQAWTSVCAAKEIGVLMGYCSHLGNSRYHLEATPSHCPRPAPPQCPLPGPSVQGRLPGAEVVGEGSGTAQLKSWK